MAYKAVKKLSGKDYIEIYFGGILSGEIIACEKMKLVSQIVLVLLHSKSGKYHFDEKIAFRHISFIETFCKQPAGRMQPLKLALFQKAILSVLYGFVDDNGLRKFNEVLLIIARKNGKSTLCSAIEIDLLVNDGEFAPNIYNIATKRDQANECFENCVKMLMQSKQLQKHVKKRSWDIYNDLNMGKIKPLASNTNTLDGLDIHCGIIDELHAIKNRDLYDLVKQAVSAREQPLLFEITTNGFYREGIFDSQYKYADQWLKGEIVDDHFIAFIYELDDRDEWTDETKWIKANPGLGEIKQTEKLRGNVEKAKNDPQFLTTVMVKDFNIKENSSSAWLGWKAISNEEMYDIAKGGFVYGIGGIDAADSVDLAAACIFLMRKDDPKIYKLSMYWLPESVIDAQTTDGNRRERDDVPYTEWVKRGLLRTSPGNKVDKRLFLEWFQEIQSEFGIYYHAIGYDPWHMTDDSIQSAFEQFLGKDNFIKVRQGAQTMSDPMKEFKADLEAKLVVNNNHPIDNWCRSNAAIHTDRNSNIALDKKDSNPKNRIDGLVAELNAYITLKRKWETYSQII